MGYTAGTLEIELLGIDQNAVNSINTVGRALSALSKAFKLIEQTQIVYVGRQLEQIFTKIASASQSIDTTNLERLASAGKALSSIAKISNLEKLDFEKVGKGFENLSVAITPFLEQVKSAEASLTALYGTLSKAGGKKIQGLLSGNTATEKGKKGGFGFLRLAKWTVILHAGRRLGKILLNIVQSGADYTETLNLWETAMGDNLNVATEFVNKMNEAYGISEKTLMNAQAIFKNMLGSLGEISDTMAYALSEGITQMALDYASLYNQTFEKAFTKFQSALAGQVRPIRSVSGYDITENTLYQLYQTLGGTKTMRQLTRTEKQLLAIYAVFQQMERSGAVGDLDKTMESFANQSRVMTETWKQLTTYVGLLLTKMIETSGAMEKLNAVLIYFSDTFKELAETMGAITHFGGDIFESTTDSALNASDAIDEVKGKLLDFDKFRALDESSESNALGLDEKLLQALSGYDSILGNASMKARELAESWMEVTFWQRDANGELVFNQEKAQGLIMAIQGIFASIQDLAPLFEIIVTNLINSGLLGIILQIGSIFTNIFVKGLNGVMPILMDIIYGLLPILIEVVESIGTMADGVSILFKHFKPIINSLLPALSLIAEVLDVIQQLGKWINLVADVVLTVLSPVIEFFAKVISTVVDLLRAAFASIRYVFAGEFDKIGSLWQNFGNNFKKMWSSWESTNNGDKDFYGNRIRTTANLDFANYMSDQKAISTATEMGQPVYANTASAQNGSANIQQAMYGALVQYGKTQGSNGQTIVVTLDGEKVYQNTTEHAKRRGQSWA